MDDGWWWVQVGGNVEISVVEFALISKTGRRKPRIGTDGLPLADMAIMAYKLHEAEHHVTAESQTGFSWLSNRLEVVSIEYLNRWEVSLRAY